MNFTFNKLVFGGLLSAVILAVPVSATPVGTGEFNLTGTLYVSTTSILFGLKSIPPPGDEMAAVALPTSGAYGNLAYGDIATVMNLTSPPNPVTGAISVPQWIQLPSGDGSLDLQSVDLYNTSLPVCSSVDSNMTGQFSCIAYVGSPIKLTQNGAGSTTATMVTHGIAYTGTSGSGSSAFLGTLTSQFNENVSALLAMFAAQGHITNSWSGVFDTTASPTVPEPGMLAGVGLGLLALGFARRKNQRSK